MTPEISIVYSTYRAEPHLEWFTRTLVREAAEKGAWELIVVDRLWEKRDPHAEGWDLANVHTAPKPTPWQGQYRHPKLERDYFAASNARNTGACFARGGYVVFVDDLSALSPGWWKGVQAAAKGGYVLAGSYAKVAKLGVSEAGEITFEGLPEGRDSRWGHGNDREAVRCEGSQTYGCCLGVPLETLLRLNGWDECADGIGFEDVLLGRRLEWAGAPLRYVRSVRITEDDGEHRSDRNEVLPRTNRAIAGYKDLAWEMLAHRGPAARGTEINLRAFNLAATERGHVEWPKDVKPFKFPDGEAAIIGL